MCHKNVAFLLLHLLTVFATGEQNLKGGQLASVSYGGAFWDGLGNSISIKSVEGSRSVSTTALEGELISGYFFTAKYLDASCAFFAIGSATLLNTCVYVYDDDAGLSGYYKLSATSTEYLKDLYSDDTCSTLKTAGTPAAYTTACYSGSKTIVQSSLSAPTTKSTLSKTYDHSEFGNFSAFPQQC
jgi:hypothetical protein